MTSGGWLKQSFGEDDRLLTSINNLEMDIQHKHWEAAKEEITYAHTAWNKIVDRIQFSVERDYIIDISGALARIKGGIEIKDDQAVMEEIYFFYELWDDLGK